MCSFDPIPRAWQERPSWCATQTATSGPRWGISATKSGWTCGTLRATAGHLGLGAEGAPGLAFYDQDQRVRAELNLGPDGEPKFTLRDQRGMETQKEPKPPDDSAHQRPPGGTGLGPEAVPLPSPPAEPTEAVSPNRDAEAEVEFVGFKNSNKYHYPTCKWVRTRYPAQLIRFKSATEAQERGYIPCPVCKPPPLSR